jgi:hypothetical protein
MHSRPERYRIQRPVEFRARNGGRPLQGTGQTLNISRGGLCFETEQLPEVGDKIECVVQMGSELGDGKESVNLNVQGITLRTSGGKVAVSVKKSRLRPVQPPDALDS